MIKNEFNFRDMKRNIESEVSHMWSKFFPSNEQIIKFLIRMKVEATVTNKFKKWNNDRKAELKWLWFHLISSKIFDAQ